jgi:hypothetical protein
MFSLTSPTSGGRSVGIVRLRTTAIEFSFLVMSLFFQNLEYICLSLLACLCNKGQELTNKVNNINNMNNVMVTEDLEQIKDNLFSGRVK